MKKNLLWLLAILVMSGIIQNLSCKKDSNTAVIPPPPVDTPSIDDPNFIRGADISWLQQMEATGFVFRDANGNEADCIDILKSKGINSLRFRLFVNPSNDPRNGHCSTKEVAVMCLKAKAKGFRIMLDFHYSNTWADPGHQATPSIWSTTNIETLKTQMYDYTYHVLDSFKTIGINPEWVQIGNETPQGMLWPLGRIASNNFTNFVQLFNKGYDAVKAVNTNIKVIVHINRGSENQSWFFDGIKAQNIKYDIIGLSYYPYFLDPENTHKDYKPSLARLKTNIMNWKRTYSKEIMIVETGDEADRYNTESYNMLVDLLSGVYESKGLGVFYWEPQSYRVWNNYPLGCWNNNGRPMQALDAFLK